MTLPANEIHQSACARHSSIRSAIEKQWRITLTPPACSSSIAQRVLVGGAGVDHERLAGRARQLDLGQEGALLVGRGRAVAVEVQAGLADRHAALVRGQRLELGEVGVVEARSPQLGWRPIAA